MTTNENIEIITEKRINQFNKIQLLNHMANQIGSYGVQCGLSQLMDYIDMNCGAVPQGEYEQVIDSGAPDQFLSMYTQIASSRFAFAVTQVLKIHPGCNKIVSDFCHQIGTDLEAEKPKTAEEAFYTMNYFVLDGMYDYENKTTTFKSETEVRWNVIKENHLPLWEKAGGDFKIYQLLLKSFVDGILSGSGFQLLVEGDSEYRLAKIS